jgi:hypothetical protein
LPAIDTVISFSGFQKITIALRFSTEVPK